MSYETPDFWLPYLESLLGRPELVRIAPPVQTGHLHQVEVDGAHQLRGRGVCHLQAGEQHVVADAVGSGEDAKELLDILRDYGSNRAVQLGEQDISTIIK